MCEESEEYKEGGLKSNVNKVLKEDIKIPAKLP